MSENGEPMKNELSKAGLERKDRMLLQLQGAMLRRTARRRTLRLGASAAAFALAAGAVWAAMVMQRSPVAPPSPAPGVPTIASNNRAAPEAAPIKDTLRRTSVSVVVVSGSNVPAAAVAETNVASIAKYVASGERSSAVQVVSDRDLMAALAQTGNEYGLVRVGDRVDVKCYSCDEGPLSTKPAAAPSNDR